MFLGAIQRYGVESYLKCPADIFAVCAKIAKITGCYLGFSEEEKPHLRIVSGARSDGSLWIRLLAKMGDDLDLDLIPRQISSSWNLVCVALNEYAGSDDSFRCSDELSAAVLYLISACDAACEGLGVTEDWNFTGKFGFESNARLVGEGTLCLKLGLRYGKVLPKMHTPKVGINLRNLTRHICYCDESEVSVGWNIRESSFYRNRNSFNLMVVPWPFKVHPTSISASKRMSSKEGVGYFEYTPVEADSTVSDICELVFSTIRGGHVVDMVVLPECALSESSWKKLSDRLGEKGVSTLSGVYAKAVGTQSTNSVRLKASSVFSSEVVQYKHHRWKIDYSQICNYSLGGTLSCQSEWWENIKLHDRRVNFFSFKDGFVFCPLICEDLARQDPVADIVRSVGPNLVIALLMDGPQLPHRWSSRYASVLADDPGSSVLTVSSLGMVNLSSPPPGVAPRKVIASWKQAGGDFVEICLEGNSKAALLNLQFQPDDEHTVDGIPSLVKSSIPVLAGVHYVK